MRALERGDKLLPSTLRDYAEATYSAMFENNPHPKTSPAVGSLYDRVMNDMGTKEDLKGLKQGRNDMGTKEDLKGLNLHPGFHIILSKKQAK